MKEYVEKYFEKGDNLLRLAFEAMLNGKIVKFKKGLLEKHQEEFCNELGKDFTIDSIESTGDLKLFNLKSTDVIYEISPKNIIITNKKAWN